MDECGRVPDETTLRAQLVRGRDVRVRNKLPWMVAKQGLNELDPARRFIGEVIFRVRPWNVGRHSLWERVGWVAPR